MTSGRTWRRERISGGEHEEVTIRLTLMVFWVVLRVLPLASVSLWPMMGVASDPASAKESNEVSSANSALSLASTHRS